MKDIEERKIEIREAITKVVKAELKLTNQNVLEKLRVPCSFTDIAPVLREWREDAYKILATLSTDAEVPDCILINVNWNKAEIPNWVYNEYQITPRKLEFLFDDIERYGKINYEYNLVGAANNNHF